MATFKTYYPATDTVAVTCAIASLADDNTNMLAGRAGTVVDNTSNLDLDHILSGKITTGTSPTAGRLIELWVYSHIDITSGTPTYPDSITGSDANKSMTSRNVLISGLKLVCSILVDSTSNRTYPIPRTSIAQLFGGRMPSRWGPFVVQGTGVALHGTSGNHAFNYERIQGQG